jgi:hypothetical protein
MGIFNREEARVFQERTLFFKWNAQARRVFAGLEEGSACKLARLKPVISGLFFDRGRMPRRSPFPHRLEGHVEHRDDEDAD